MERYFTELAVAFVRGRLGRSDATLEEGFDAGLRLHKFKQNTELPRVKRVLGMLHGLAPESLLDIGSGRGTFLWPLLASFPDLPVTAIDWSERRVSDLVAVRTGGVERLSVERMDVEHLSFPPAAFDVVTMLEVLEHLSNPVEGLRRVVQTARRAVIVSVPSVPDENPEHLHLFRVEQLRDMAAEAGCSRVTLEHVLNHRIMLCQKP
ncbi:MAG TPA: class I SAM-dependent methyltransferase [Acidobacteriaceae bacterium]|jgi:2-polyprenyl-3-methyl-5-hydroxy-6-metoxy-1,4-benzoquinol methylase